jgi:prevent-host-death family protein
MAIIYGYNFYMNVSTANAKNKLPELLRAAEQGELITITRHGKPVAQLGPPAASTRKVQFGSMKDRIQLFPGWDAPIDEDRFLEGDL